MKPGLDRSCALEILHLVKDLRGRGFRGKTWEKLLKHLFSIRPDDSVTMIVRLLFTAVATAS